MAITFDYTTQLISVPQAESAPLLIQTLLNAIRAEEASERGITYSATCTATGKDSLGGAVAVGITLSLLWAWEVSFAAGAYQATIDGGNLANALNRINNTGNPQVLVNASAAATVVATGGSALTSDEHAQLMALPAASANAVAVWTKVLEGALTAEQLQRLLLSALSGKVSGAGSGTESFRDLADTKDRLIVTVDANGNRTSVVRDAA